MSRKDFDSIKLEKRSLKHRISKSIHDKDTGTVFGRTGKDWGKLFLFYLIFYAVLAGLFAICMAALLLLVVNPRIPNLQLERSVIGTSPGLGFRPLPADVRSTFISFKGTSYDSYKYWKTQLTEFLSVYKKKGQQEGAGQNIASCSFDIMPRPGQVCDVQIRDFDPCIEEKHFYYHKSSPCIFLKLNRIFGWTPNYYDANELPSDMPTSLQHKIGNLTHENQNQAKMVWLSCRGETPADEENMGPIKYYPYPGFPGYYFPYMNTEGYLSPLVAVHFESPNRFWLEVQTIRHLPDPLRSADCDRRW
ncbi:hypothetical protein EVAR_52256_1 [Eumeta japonica]|uniref:Sodium/potassium-transporting ATPase subunit beta-2 n=1 Tax=Eumeta variegata TaxID=151549 RepID=A0A4C1YPS4_EUMVA|nr:hypothetical protein EVAR_52256_1 [Eumeta japonica]